MGLRQDQYPDRSLEGEIDDNLEGVQSGTEDRRGKVPEGEFMGRYWEQYCNMKLELREVPMMCSNEVTFMDNLKTTDWGSQYYQDPLMVDQVIL